MTALSSPSVSVLIMTRNEAENLRTLLPRIVSTLSANEGRLEVIIVDADSPDGTADVAKEHGARVVRQSLPGYANALRQGFAECRGDTVITLDADFSHNPDMFQTMLHALDDADLVIASRYIPGGSADMPHSRRILSLILNRIFAVTLGLSVHDMSSGFRIYRRAELMRLQPRGDYFDVLPEIVALASFAGLRVREIPFHYYAREAGVSKARVFKFMPSYLRTLFRCWRARFAKASRISHGADQIE
jgi:dolichol-phosphate mannosyltransferase